MKKDDKIRFGLSSFNLIKGFGMVVIIMEHMIATDHYEVEELELFFPFRILLHLGNFIVPMYLIISGFGFHEKNVKEQLKKTFAEMIVPYLYVMISIAVLYPIAFYLNTNSWTEAANSTICYTLAYLVGVPKYGKVILGYHIAWISAVWYLLALFIAFNILNLIVKVKNTYKQIALVLLSVMIGYVLITLELNYYCLPQGLIAVGFCYLGYQIKRSRLLERYWNCTKVYAILIPITFVHLAWGFFNLAPGEFCFFPLDYICAGCSAILLILISINLGKYEWFILDLISYVGMYSYWIICIHSVEMGLPQWTNLVDSFAGHQVMAFVFEVLLKIIIIWAICSILKRIKLYKCKKKGDKRWEIIFLKKCWVPSPRKMRVL